MKALNFTNEIKEVPKIEENHEKEIKEEKKFRHKVYMRDWYFNAGITGFLDIIGTSINDNEKDCTNIEDIQNKYKDNLFICENYIEFNDDVFENFEEKFIKKAFLMFFDIKIYIYILQNILKEYEEKKEKFKITTEITKKLENNKVIYEILGIILNKETIEVFSESLKNGIEKLSNITNEFVYSEMIKTQSGKEFIDYINMKLDKGIISTKKTKEYFENIKKIDYKKVLKNNDKCLSCQTLKANQKFNNAVSNVVGYNSRNTNWIWGFKDTNVKVCDLCALIYTCAFNSFAVIVKKIGSDWLNYFYIINKNSDIGDLYENIFEFKQIVKTEKDQHSKIYLMIKESVRKIRNQQYKNIKDNINFIEIIDNPILAGQSNKGYNVYNYNINYEISIFLEKYFVKNIFPKGYYKIKDIYIDIEEEILKLSIANQINYQLLNKYINILISSSIQEKDKKINLYFISEYILNYINQFYCEDKMEKNEKIITKGFHSGKDLRTKMFAVKKDNQIDGIVYAFLNSLKTCDRELFLDKYIRITMSYQIESKFGKEEMLDNDSFLQFGYSFINGLLNKYEENNTTANNTNNSN